MRKRGLFALLLALALLLAACGGEESTEKNPEESAPPAEEEQRVCRETVYPFSSDTKIRSMARSGNHLLLLGERGERHVLALADYTVDAQGRASLGEARELTAEPPDLGPEVRWYGLTADADENFWLLLGAQNENAASATLCAQKYLPDGRFFFSVTIEGWEHGTADGFAVGPNKELVLEADNCVAVYDPHGRLLRETQLDGWSVESVTLGPPGVIVSFCRREPASGQTLALYMLVDSKSGELTEMEFEKGLPSEAGIAERREHGQDILPCQGFRGEYLVNQGNAICRIDLTTGAAEELNLWNLEQTPSFLLGSSCRLSETCFACLLDGELILSWSETAEIGDVSLVRVAVFGDDTASGMELTVRELDSRIEDYRYEVLRYDTADRSRFSAELAMGSFDLVLSSSQLNTSSSLFLDLYPLIDADPDLSRESFLPHLLESTQTHGELHQLWNSVQIMTYAVPKRLVPDPHGLTLADCERIVEEHEEIAAVLFNLTDPEMIARDYPVVLANLALAAFVDKETATCRLDSDEFREWLAWIGSIKPGTEDGPLPTVLRTCPVTNAESLEQMGRLIGAFSLCGLPDGADGVSMYLENGARGGSLSMEIPANSRNVPGAWALIKETLSDEQQLKIARNERVSDRPGMPVMIDMLRYVNANAPQEYQDMLFDLVERTKWAQSNFDEELIQLIASSCQPYMHGEKSLDETVKLIQAKASIYVSERYS